MVIIGAWQVDPRPAKKCRSMANGRQGVTGIDMDTFQPPANGPNTQQRRASIVLLLWVPKSHAVFVFKLSFGCIMTPKWDQLSGSALPYAGERMEWCDHSHWCRTNCAGLARGLGGRIGAL